MLCLGFSFKAEVLIFVDRFEAASAQVREAASDRLTQAGTVVKKKDKQERNARSLYDRNLATGTTQKTFPDCIHSH